MDSFILSYTLTHRFLGTDPARLCSRSWGYSDPQEMDGCSVSVELLARKVTINSRICKCKREKVKDEKRVEGMEDAQSWKRCFRGPLCGGDF